MKYSEELCLQLSGSRSKHSEQIDMGEVGCWFDFGNVCGSSLSPGIFSTLAQ